MKRNSRKGKGLFDGWGAFTGALSDIGNAVESGISTVGNVASKVAPIASLVKGMGEHLARSQDELHKAIQLHNHIVQHHLQKQKPTMRKATSIKKMNEEAKRGQLLEFQGHERNEKQRNNKKMIRGGAVSIYDALDDINDLE